LSPKKTLGASSPQKLVPDDDKAGKSPAFASEDYNKVARAAKLEAIMLAASSFHVLPDYFETQRENGPEKEFSYKAVMQNDTYDPASGVASCVWNWSVEVKVSRKKALVIEASYLIIYEQVVDCNPEAVKCFLHRVGRFATYPYYRAHVSQVSWESSTKLPLMPTIAT
jgi:hypothetical protein